MKIPFNIIFENKRYTYDGVKWYGADDFIEPPKAIASRLNAIISQELAADDAEISDAQELLDRAKRAQANGQIQRAVDLARRVYESNHGHIGAASVLCSILRELGHANEALTIANQFINSNYPPILTFRAAALCDLGRWEEALRQCRRVMAIGFQSNGTGSPEALAVFRRIKANAPELFD
jgi:tetratricopeptide (TPR) repeat protein